MKFKEFFIKNFLSKRRYRRLILLSADLFIVFFIFCITFWFTGDYTSFEKYQSILILLLLNAIILYPITGQYNGITRFSGSSNVYFITFRVGCLLFLIHLYSIFFGLPILDIKKYLFLFTGISYISSLVRIVLSDLILKARKNLNPNIPRVAIYGAGEAGSQLAASLRVADSHIIVCFFDDNRDLWYRSINGVIIKPTDQIEALKSKFDQILLAIPSIDNKNRLEIIKKIQELDISILEIPTLNDLTKGKAKINNLKKINIEDLLFRNKVPPMEELLKESVLNKVVCITGGGGSIGSELCRQIIKLNPKKLIIVDNSEENLYLINQELSGNSLSKNKIIVKLGNVASNIFVKSLFKEIKIDMLFHAAAYKHVPLVEINPFESIKNNVFSTFNLCKEAYENKILKFIFVSSDKAVRPTNLMGATKRIGELIVQSFHQELLKNNLYNNPKNTNFSMVRFGNVIGSSGSVVPLFKKQISKGGPVTITDKKIIRYFMTIKEAVELVLQSSFLAEGGELFLLDMGKPISIYSLAQNMIRLSGLKVKDIKNPDGDIEIITTGLRPGEKLYEELLIDAESEKTLHPLIYKAKEKFLDYETLNEYLNELEEALNSLSINKTIKIVSKIVPEWEIDKTLK